MTDIVERLRARATRAPSIMNDAANEIAKLRAAVLAAEAKVARLEAAHREIVALAAGSQGAYGKFARAQKISQDALKDTTP